jgi:hypothetical protein
MEFEQWYSTLNKSIYISFSEVTEKFIKYSLDYGNIMKFWIFHKLVVFIADPRDVEVTSNLLTNSISVCPTNMIIINLYAS